MKISLVLAVLSGMMATADAFSVTPITRQHLQTTSILRAPFCLHESSTGVEKSEESATEKDTRSTYEKIGISRDDLAMGVNPEEVYEWIGT
jgi:hypothetical protein